MLKILKFVYDIKFVLYEIYFEISIDTNNTNIQFLNIYPYLIIKFIDLYIKTDNFFEPEV